MEQHTNAFSSSLSFEVNLAKNHHQRLLPEEEQVAGSIQHDHLVYFEKLKYEKDWQQGVWEAMVESAGERLKEYMLEAMMFRDSIPKKDRNIKLGYAGFNRKRYVVRLVLDRDYNVFNLKIVLSPVYQCLK